MTTLPKGTIKRLHVDQGILRHAQTTGCDLAALTIQTSKGSIKAREVQILGPSTLVQSLTKPLSCGARVYIETRSAIRYA